MGATAAIGTLVGRGKATQPDQHRLGAHRLYAHLGPLATIIGGPDQHRLGENRLYAHIGPRATTLVGPSGSGTVDQKTARQQLWFRDSQFLFTHSPFTKES